MGLAETYINYGVSNEIATMLENRNLSKTNFKTTPIEQLIDVYGIEEHIVEFVMSCITRKPIDDAVVFKLLENSNFTCCLCKGLKSDAYIIHHIIEYSKKPDNSYENLAVLCPNDHDLAHRRGIALTNRITTEQIRMTKDNWESYLRSRKDVRTSWLRNEEEELSKFRFKEFSLTDNQAHNIPIDLEIHDDTKLGLRVKHTSTDQTFVVYLSIVTDLGDQKWIGFGTPLGIKNIYPSERIFRVGNPGELKYSIIENIIERINESGLQIKGEPRNIKEIRFWGGMNNDKKIIFEYDVK